MQDLFLITDKSKWHSQDKNQQAEFLQSWEYGEFLKKAGREIWRVSDGHGLYTQGIVWPLPFGMHHVYLPRMAVDLVGLGKLVDFFKQKGVIFVRLEPLEELDLSGYLHKYFENLQPQHTWRLDLTWSEEEFLAQMHSKTRYNIRLAEKKGVEIREEKDVELYWRLEQATTVRNRFSAHKKEHYVRLLQMPGVRQFNAHYHGHPIASAIILQYGDKIFYLYGASSNSDRRVMAPYLLQWKIITTAHTLGCGEYDMWGIAPEVGAGSEFAECFHGFCWDRRHRLAGVARFKAGFGGQLYTYPRGFDIILKPAVYYLYQALQKVKNF